MVRSQKEPPPAKTYTYADYLTWPEGERWELIAGIPHAKEGGTQAMSPAPSRRHQQVLFQLARLIGNFLQEKTCQIYLAPFDVRFQPLDGANKKMDTVVQPDITVICDRAKLDDKGCVGSPDWIIEVVSPGSGQLDYVKKFNLYEAQGVKEYWIIHPFDETLMVFKLGENGLYGRQDVYTSTDQVMAGLFQGALVIDLALVFAD